MQSSRKLKFQKTTFVSQGVPSIHNLPFNLKEFMLAYSVFE